MQHCDIRMFLIVFESCLGSEKSPNTPHQVEIQFHFSMALMPLVGHPNRKPKAREAPARWHATREHSPNLGWTSIVAMFRYNSMIATPKVAIKPAMPAGHQCVQPFSNPMPCLQAMTNLSPSFSTIEKHRNCLKTV